METRETLTRAALYVRVSSQKQAEKWSLQAQRKLLTEHAARRGWDPILYDEGAVSAETLTARPVMQRLLRDAAAGDLGVVLVIEIERLCRASDLTDWATITTTLRRAGVLVATPEREFDLAKAEDDFEADLRGVLSKREKRKLLERCARGRAQARNAGKWLGGRAPWGYRFNKATATLEVIPERAEIVREIFASPWGGKTLHAQLRRRGVVISEYTLHGLRRRLTYAGKQLDTAGNVVDGTWPAIVSYETWLAAQPAIEARRTSRAYRAKYLLVGLLTCAGCGKAVGSTVSGASAASRMRKQSSYVCRTWQRGRGDCDRPGTIAQWGVDTLVLDAWARHVADRGVIRAGYDALVARLTADREEGRYERMEQALRSVQARRARVLDALESGVVTPEDVGGRLRALDGDRAGLEAERARLAAERGQAAVPSWELVEAMLRRFPRATINARRAVLGAFLEGITLDLAERWMEIRWRFGEPVAYALPNLHSLTASAGGSDAAKRALKATASRYLLTRGPRG